MLQLEAAARLGRQPWRVAHVVEVVAAAYGPEGPPHADGVGKR